MENFNVNVDEIKLNRGEKDLKEDLFCRHYDENPGNIMF
jgi:hypothetical protein